MHQWQNVFYGSPLPADRTASSNLGVPMDSRLEQAEVIPGGPTRRSPSPLTASALPLLALLLGCVLLLSICNRLSGKVTKPGLLNRRLAGDDDEENPSSVSELELLCEAAQEWTPIEQPAGEPRRSPGVVEAYFQLLGDPPLFEEEETAASQPTQTRAPDDGDDQEEQAGPSRKFLRTDQGREPEAPPPPSFAASPTPSTSFAPGPGAATWQAWQPQQGPASAGILPVSGAGPSTSTAPPGPPMAQPPSGVPQGRSLRPRISPGVRPRPWRTDVVFAPRQERCRTKMMQKIHRLLVKEVLDGEEMEVLIDQVEGLANFALNRFEPLTSPPLPSSFVHRAGVRFLVFSELHAAVQLLSNDLPEWWQPVADAALEGWTDLTWVKQKAPGRPSPSRHLINALAAALALYKSGSAPSPEEDNRLRYMLLKDAAAPMCFLSPEWGILREDF